MKKLLVIVCLPLVLALTGCGRAEVSLSSDPEAVAVLAGAGTYATGEQVTVNVSPEPGWIFVNWSLGGKVVAETEEYTFTAKGKTVLTANLQPREYAIATRIQGQGTVKAPEQPALHGNSFTLAALPAEGHRFVCWLEGEQVIATAAEFTFPANGDRELTAVFLPEIKLEYDSSCGAVAETWTLAPATYTFTATPEPGYEFFGWVDKQTGQEISLAASYTFAWQEGRDLLARFRKKLVTFDGSDLIAVVGKGTTIGKYAPGDLVVLPSELSSKRRQVRRDTASALTVMAEAAAIDGVKLNVDSGYRSYSTQYDLFYRYAKRDGVLAAERYSARAGQSEHQLGTCVDFGGTSKDYSDAFAETSMGKWLLAHAHEYGFALSYPAGKEAITGYKYEPWHYRYIGVELALEWKESGLTLIEFLQTKNQAN